MKLHIKKDGTLYMKRPVPGIGWTTWQVTPDGIDLLARKRVNIGDEIPEKVFDELLRKNFLYTGGSGPGDEVEFPTGERTGWGGGSNNGRPKRNRSASKSKTEDQGSCLGVILLLIILFVVVKLVT